MFWGRAVRKFGRVRVKKRRFEIERLDGWTFGRWDVKGFLEYFFFLVICSCVGFRYQLRSNIGF